MHLFPVRREQVGELMNEFQTLDGDFHRLAFVSSSSVYRFNVFSVG